MLAWWEPKCFDHGGDMKPRFRITYCLTSSFYGKRRQPLERAGTGYSGSLWLFNIPHAMIGFEKSDFHLTFKQGFWQCLAVGYHLQNPKLHKFLKRSFSRSSLETAPMGTGPDRDTVCSCTSQCVSPRGGPLWAQCRPTMVWRREKMNMVISILL